MGGIVEFLILRGRIYKLFSDFFFIPPNFNYFNQIVSYISFLKTFGIRYDIIEIGEGAKIFESSDFKRGSLVSEFNRIFDFFSGIVPKESFYFPETGKVNIRLLSEIYSMEGACCKDNFNSFEDHIKVEFDFMALMTEKMIGLLEAGMQKEFIKNISVQHNFLEGHLKPFTASLRRDIENLASSCYFRGISMMAEGFAKADALFLEEYFALFR